MTIQRYRLFLFILLILWIGIGIFILYSGNFISSIHIPEWWILQRIRDSLSTTPIAKTPTRRIIPIQDIISKRYLYTLTKSIENQYSTLAFMSREFDSSYQTYSHVELDGNNFIFTIRDRHIEIPISSYFFDRWNTIPHETTSWEIWISTDTNEQIDKKFIALTFDDGPSKKNTIILLDILKSENVKATFYVLWSRVEQYPDILKREYLEWHEIGNHSYSHTLLTKLSNRMMQDELYKTDQAIYHTIGIYPWTFRPPYGWVNTNILEKAAMPAILWSIDPRDWKTHNIAKDIASVKNAKDGDILIMHDIHEASVASIPAIIKNLRDRWFIFVTVSELLSLSETNTQIWKKCTRKWKCI